MNENKKINNSKSPTVSTDCTHDNCIHITATGEDKRACIEDRHVHYAMIFELVW